ncbi:hypothetical protein BN14_03148 [Rhizoctonia solani AG-1 IB]|uniref:Uncharacterized protein n=1 Tax=Thanatephorus cucumeris (strain AG1-IB / isolate 7/3/14) TaxID=1108050 RepID=M5BPT0_THACB|nr:hypothetical protein BN14_03148 [Rhizoctonia solani AG-1 IB]
MIGPPALLQRRKMKLRKRIFVLRFVLVSPSCHSLPSEVHSHISTSADPDPELQLGITRALPKRTILSRVRGALPVGLDPHPLVPTENRGLGTSMNEGEASNDEEAFESTRVRIELSESSRARSDMSESTRIGDE